MYSQFALPQQSSKLAKLGKSIDPSYVVYRNGSWYIQDPSLLGRKGFFSVVAEWCGYCTKLAASMDQARRSYDIVSVYVEGDKAGKQLAQKMGVEGFPTVFTFDTTGKLSSYDGDRSPSALNSAVNSQSGGGFSWW
jgi:thiol-disulfide isomerase/thioredoxin